MSLSALPLFLNKSLCVFYTGRNALFLLQNGFGNQASPGLIGRAYSIPQVPD